MSWHRAFIGLGSNLQNPRKQLEHALQALARLPESRLTATSALYQSRPVGPPQPDYLNAVACLHTALTPLTLLDQLQSIEDAQGRERKERWGPRTLDLDLLLYDDQKLALPRLQLPHPELAQRPFVLYPLADIAPDLTLPGGDSLQDLLQTCPHEGLQRLTDTGAWQAASIPTNANGHRET